MNRILTLLLFGFMISSAAFGQNDTTLLSPTQFEKAISTDNALLLDVRTPEEYKKGHIKNSLLVDWKKSEQFAEKAKSLDTSKTVYVYCAAGVRSHAAAEWLRSNGFTHVYELDGGMDKWKEEKKPVER